LIEHLGMELGGMVSTARRRVVFTLAIFGVQCSIVP
jgi:hypothetical protein